MKSKSIILSKNAIIFLAATLVFSGFAVYFFIADAPLWGWISVLCSAFFLIAAACVPLFYVVDRTGIRIRYLTGDKELYEWKRVRQVVAEYDLTVPYIFDTFRIDGDDYTAYMFYKEGRMERSRALACAIERYSGKAVKGLIPDGLKAGATRRFKLSYGKAPDASEIMAAERRVRKEVREALSSVGATSLTHSYVYTTADGEVLSRPAVDYTYSLLLTQRGTEPVKIKLVVARRRGKVLKLTYEMNGEDIRKQIGNSI